MPSVVLADDHRLILEAVRVTLDASDDMRVVGEADCGSRVLPVVRRTSPDLLLLDLRMPGTDGFACLDRLGCEVPSVKTVVFSAYDDADSAARALRSGAVAFVSKRIDPRDLASALRQAYEGTVFQQIPAETPTPERVVRDAGLTERELEMLRGLARGLSNEQIGRDAWIAAETVKFHLSNVYRKLNVRNRTEAARFAYQSGLCAEPVEPARPRQLA